MVDALASGAGVRKVVRVRLPHPVRNDETRIVCHRAHWKQLDRTDEVMVELVSSNKAMGMVLESALEPFAFN